MKTDSLIEKNLILEHEVRGFEGYSVVTMESARNQCGDGGKAREISVVTRKRDVVANGWK